MFWGAVDAVLVNGLWKVCPSGERLKIVLASGYAVRRE